MIRQNSTTSNIDRQRVIESYLSGNSVATISSVIRMKRSTVAGIIKLYQNTGRILANVRGGARYTKLNENHKNEIKRWIDEDCTLSLRLIRNKMKDNFNISVSIPTIFRYIDAFHYSLKRISLIPTRRNCRETILARRAYAMRYIGLPVAFSQSEIIFIDEVGFKVSTRVSQGRAKIGRPAIATVPNIRSRNISICCAMSIAGIIEYKSQPFAFNVLTFKDFLKSLVTILQDNNISNAIFIMDNVAFHKNHEITKFIEESGYCYDNIPPYSPFLNPIENLFSKWKDYTKRINARNEQELMKGIAEGRSFITQSDCEGYFRNMVSYLTRSINEEVIDN